MSKRNLSQQTAERLYNSIVAEGTLRPGDKLPNEVELSQQLGGEPRHPAGGHPRAGRPWECWRSGGGRGPLCRRKWRTSRTSASLGWSGFRGQLRDLFELRSIFEPKAARLACQRATEEELRDILERGEAVERCIRAGQDRTEADRDFHAAIVRAAHNEFMVRLLPVIHQAVAAAVESGEHGEQLAEDTLRDHALLLEFLAKRDGEGAEHAMAIHMPQHGGDGAGMRRAERRSPACTNLELGRKR